MKKLIPIIAGALLIALSACDKVKNPYTTGGGGGGPTGPKERKILIEDFTGHKCGNCPVAPATIETIKQVHGDRVISIGLHTNFYATPGASPYDYDFRTKVGDDYDAFFAPPGWPNGMVNRQDYPSTGHWKGVGQWSTLADALLALPPDAFIEISNSYNSTTRVLNSTVKTEFLSALNGTYKIMMLLTEDSIVSPQKFYNPNVDSLTYVHRHVLRDAISSTSWGDTLASGLITAGDTVVKNFSYTLPADFKGKVPKEKHCAVVAFIYDAASYEIIQAEEKKIQ